MLKSSNMTGFFTKSISDFITNGYYNRNPAPETCPYILGTSPPDSSMELYILDTTLQVCNIPKDCIKEFCYPIIKIALLPSSRPDFFSITETSTNYTLIVTKDDYDDLSAQTKLECSGQPWKALTISVGALGAYNELQGVTKIAKSAIGPLADANISVLCLSTYQSDYILIQESDLEAAIQCLSSYFKIFNEDHKRVNDAKILSTSPVSPLLKKARPIVHPYTSPSQTFHVTGLDRSKLNCVTQVLLELLFFQGSDAEYKSQETFFHFSVVRGDISLVLNDRAFKKFPNNVLYTRRNDDKWRIIAVGEEPLGFEECGIVAQIVEPLANAQLSTYYISAFNFEYCMVLEKDLKFVLKKFEKLKKENYQALETEVNVEETNSDLKNCMLNIPVTSGSENMSLGKTLQTIELDYSFHRMPTSAATATVFSQSPQTPISECSSYGTSPPSDTDSGCIPENSVDGGEATTTSVPIPIPNQHCLKDSLTRLKCDC